MNRVTSLHAYTHAFFTGEAVTVEGLCGRIVRGTSPQDFDTLSDDPSRKIVLLVGPDGLQELPGRSGYDMLKVIGYTPQHIARHVRAGKQFKLAVFPESKVARPATWDNMLDITGMVYPAARSALDEQRNALQTTPFEHIQAAAGYSFAEVDHAGPADPRYMTYERYLLDPRGLIAARAFLYFSVHLRELYSGDGYTYTAAGERGLQEYAVLNRPIHELGAHALLDLPPIELPRS